MKTLLGHQKIYRFFEQVLKQGGLAHAYLFVGPESLGKRTFAQKLAQKILCQESLSRAPCQNCQACLEIKRGIHPDIYFFEAPRIEEVRELRKSLQLTPLAGSYKIAILDSFHQTGQAAQNALLKILEEPPTRSLMILVSSYLEFLNPTIISRTQIIRFQPVSIREIESFLSENFDLSPDIIREVAFLSQGRPGQALKIASSSREYLEKISGWAEEFFNLLERSLAERFKFLKKDYFQDLKETLEVLSVWLLLLREALRFPFYQQSLIFPQLDKKLKALRQSLTLEQVQRLIRMTSETTVALQRPGSNSRLLLTNLLINL